MKFMACPFLMDQYLRFVIKNYRYRPMICKIMMILGISFNR
jgi:hypothetical protein